MHHLETVTGSLPNCSASHLPMRPVSANTTLFDLIFDVLFLFPLNKKLNLNAKLLYFSDVSKNGQYVVKHILQSCLIDVLDVL